MGFPGITGTPNPPTQTQTPGAGGTASPLPADSLSGIPPPTNQEVVQYAQDAFRLGGPGARANRALGIDEQAIRGITYDGRNLRVPFTPPNEPINDGTLPANRVMQQQQHIDNAQQFWRRTIGNLPLTGRDVNVVFVPTRGI